METTIRILLADANPDFGKLLSERFAAERGIELVGIAADGLEALDMLRELRPDLLLTELVLPKLDGLELLRRLPEIGVRCRCIVLSGFFNNKVIADCAARGADYFMPKPCDLGALLERVRQLADGEGEEPPLEGIDCRPAARISRQEADLEATVTDRVQTPGSSSQTALSIDLRAFVSRGEEVLAENTWPLKGVGADEADAWLRAAKQVLPRSKAAQAFLEEVKSKL